MVHAPFLRALPVLAALLAGFSLQAFAAPPVIFVAPGSSSKPGTGAARPANCPPPPSAGPICGPMASSARTVNLFPAAVNGLQVDVNGAASALNGDVVTRMDWNWGDGRRTTGLFPQSHTYSAKGQYGIQVTAYYKELSAFAATTSQAVSVGPGILQNCFELNICAGNGGTVSYKASVGAGELSGGQSLTLRLAQAGALSLAGKPNPGNVFSGWTASAGVTGVNAAPIARTASPITIVVNGAHSKIAAGFGAAPCAGTPRGASPQPSAPAQVKSGGPSQ